MASRKKGTGTSSRKAKGSPVDAVKLLKADHREVAGWFEAFEKSRSNGKKADLAAKICSALTVHMRIEEEVLYPAFLKATKDKDLHHEAEVEHASAKRLIAEIEASNPSDDYFDAKVKVLSEMIKHHVKEEEQPGGMFAEARESRIDLKSIGARLQQRKDLLMNDSRSAR